MKKRCFLLLLLFIVFLSATQALSLNKTIRGNDVVITESRVISLEYRKISVDGFFDVVLAADAQKRVTIRGEENLIPYVLTEVKNGTLTIKSQDHVWLKPRRTLQLIVPFKNIDAVSLYGSGDVVIQDVIVSDDVSLTIAGSGNMNVDVEAENVSVSIAGSGNVAIAGITNTLDVDIAGSGNIEAYNLDSRVVLVAIKGSGNLETTARDRLEGTIMGSGDIRYKGSPSLQVSAMGSGTVKYKLTNERMR